MVCIAISTISDILPLGLPTVQRGDRGTEVGCRMTREKQTQSLSLIRSSCSTSWVRIKNEINLSGKICKQSWSLWRLSKSQSRRCGCQHIFDQQAWPTGVDCAVADDFRARKTQRPGFDQNLPEVSSLLCANLCKKPPICIAISLRLALLPIG